MKKLILLSVFTSLPLFAGNEIFNQNDSNQLVSTIKDIEVEDMLNNTKEFNECRQKNPVAKGTETTAEATKKIQDAQECFRKKLSGKDPEALKKIAESLNLQDYGLVKSKNVKDIQNYLNSKMYKALTGVDPDEQNKKNLAESLKFKNKKHIDQALFIRLYKMQLSKNTLYEISRFCFQDLRRDETSPNKTPITTFDAYWKGFVSLIDQTAKNKFDVKKVTDTGGDQFKMDIKDPNNKEEVYEGILKSINADKKLSSANLQEFYLACSYTIIDLCEEFKSNNKSDKTTSQVNAPSAKGAASCLSKNRILELKKALADTDKVEKYFGEIQESDDSLVSALMKGQPIKIFAPGHDGAESMDNLTNFTSKDIVEGGFTQDQQLEQKAKECQQRPELTSCEGILSDRENFDKTLHNVEMEMTLKREVEMARVRELKDKGQQQLKDYLKENGYFKLLEKYEKGGLTDDQVVTEIGAEFEAKKVATLQELNNKMGSRQVKKDADAKDFKKKATAAVDETKEERARLAQVVMFNNIITSHLELSRKDAKGNTKSAGRNVNAWKKEEQDLKATVKEDLFSNLKATDDGKNTNGIKENEQIGGLDFINGVLGNKPD